MFSIFKYIFLTARRDWLFLGIFILMLLIVTITILIGSTSLVEQSQTITSLLTGSIRNLIVLGISLFTCFHVKRSFDNKEVDFFLSKPISRNKFVLSYFGGICLITALLVIPATIFMISIKTLGILYGFTESYIAWSVSLFVEVMIVISFALFSSLLLKSSTAAMLATVGFYSIARIMGYFIIMVQNPVASGKITLLGKIYTKALWGLAFLFPRLDQFAQTDWLIYGILDYKLFFMFMLSGLIYVALILSMTLFDFSRHEF